MDIAGLSSLASANQLSFPPKGVFLSNIPET